MWQEAVDFRFWHCPVVAQHAAPLQGNSYALILSIENEIRKRGESARILGIRAAVEASLGALRVFLSEIARPVERAGFVNERNDCFRTNRNKFLFFQYTRDQLTRVTVPILHRVDQGQRDLAFFQIAEDRFAEL